MFRNDEEIKQEMLKYIQNTVDKRQNSLTHDAISVAAVEFANFSLKLQTVADKQDVENLEGEELEQFVYQRTAIERKPATKATTTVIMSGQGGTTFPQGSLVSTGEINFVTIEDATIGESGQVSVIVECEEFGSVGNVPANTIVLFPISIPGVVDVYNPEPVTNSYDAESDDDLRSRYYEKLQRPVKAGNKYHYEQWAKEVVGVGGVRVVPRWNGPLTIKLIIIDSNGQPARQDLIDDVFSYIETQRPFGADVTVVSAIGVPINVSVNLVLADGYTEEAVKEDIAKNIVEHLKSIAFKANYVSYAQIGSIILNTEGVLDYSDLLINGGTVNIPVADDEVAIMGVIE